MRVWCIDVSNQKLISFVVWWWWCVSGALLWMLCCTGGGGNVPAGGAGGAAGGVPPIATVAATVASATAAAANNLAAAGGAQPVPTVSAPASAVTSFLPPSWILLVCFTLFYIGMWIRRWLINQHRKHPVPIGMRNASHIASQPIPSDRIPHLLPAACPAFTERIVLLEW